jgi:tetratricopeptide (TPR) repeat protein
MSHCEVVMRCRVELLTAALACVLALACATASPESHLRAGKSALDAGDVARAQRELEAAHAAATPDAASPSTRLQVAVELGDLYATYPDLRHESDADDLYREALEIVQQANMPDAKLAGLLQRIADYYMTQNRWEDAIPFLERFVEGAKHELTPEQVYRSREASYLVEAYTKAGRHADAAKLQKLIDEPLARAAVAGDQVVTVPASELYLAPNARDSRGRPIYLHFEEKDMPLRVSLGPVDVAASDGSAEETARAAAAGIRRWETSVQRIHRWFRLDIVANDASAPVQVVWLRHPPGYAGGFGEILRDESGPEPRVRAKVTLSTQPVPIPNGKLKLSQVQAYAVHAFGGALGLGYCWDCDSVRSMDWLARNDLVPTDLDLRTLEALMALPNGAPGPVDVAADERGVLADLPFLNVGTERQIFLDIAPRGSLPFVVQLDTGAPVTMLTPAFARVIGVATRSAREDENWCDTVTGRKLPFYVTSQFAANGGRLEGMNYALLGGEFLQQFVVEIDYRRQRVRFLDPDVVEVGGAQPQAGERVVPMPVAANWPHVELGIGGHSVLALLDTGDEGSLGLTEEAAGQLGIAVDPHAPHQTWQNVLSTSQAAVQQLPLLQIGPVSLQNVEMAIALRSSGVRIERFGTTEVTVGQGVLRHFVARFDYPRQRLGLTPIDDARLTSAAAPSAAR